MMRYGTQYLLVPDLVPPFLFISQVRFLYSSHQSQNAKAIPIRHIVVITSIHQPDRKKTLKISSCSPSYCATKIRIGDTGGVLVSVSLEHGQAKGPSCPSPTILTVLRLNSPEYLPAVVNERQPFRLPNAVLGASPRSAFVALGALG